MRSIGRAFVLVALAALVFGATSASPARTNHIAGATYTGTHSGGGTVLFTVSADGTQITAASFTIRNIPGVPSGCPNYVVGVSIAIANHAFSFQSGETLVKGAFLSVQAATGTFKEVTKGFPYDCESPTLTWSATTTASPPPPPPPPPAPPPLCTVPNVKGKTVPAARAALTKAHCTVGRISRAYSSKVKKGRVISQNPRLGARLPNRGKVSLVISRGRKP